MIDTKDIEFKLISRLLLDPSQVGQVDLQPEDFSDPEAGKAFDMIRHGDQDIATLQAAGIDVDITDLTPFHTASVDQYVNIIRSRQSAFEVVDLSQHRNPPPDPLLGVIDPGGTTVLYGDGGDGKGWVAAKLISDLTQAGVVPAILDFEHHPGEWAYRLDKFNTRLDDVVYPEMTNYMEREADRGLGRLLLAKKVGMIVVDSAIYASDTTDPYGPQSAMSFKRARYKLGNLPVLLLAHIAKGAGSPFGSVFWRNEARLLWFLRRSGLSRQRYMECTKANAYPALEGKRLNIEFDEERGILNLHGDGAWAPEPEREVADTEEELSWG